MTCKEASYISVCVSCIFQTVCVCLNQNGCMCEIVVNNKDSFGCTRLLKICISLQSINSQLFFLHLPTCLPLACLLYLYLSAASGIHDFFPHDLQVKLNAFEDRLGKQIESSKKLPQMLAAEGKIWLGQREIDRKIGELLMDTHGTTLHRQT